MRIALAGLGAAARTIHLPALASLPRLEVVGGTDPAAPTAGFRFPVFASLDEMLERARPDIVAVAAPTAFHYELTRRSLEAGCHVFCEKPFMSTLAEADEIVALAQSRGRRVVVNNQYRFMEVHRAAKGRIGMPGFGELLFLSANQTFRVSERTEAGWRGQDPQRTCKEFGIHVLDLCRYFFGEEPRSISARMPRGSNPGGPDHLNLILLEFSGDRVAQIVLDRLSRGPQRYLDLRLDGSEGVVETSLGGAVEVTAGIRGRSRRPHVTFDVSLGGRARLHHGERFHKIASDPLDLFAHATRGLLEAFLEALDAGTAPPCDAEDNRNTLALMLAAYASDAAGEPVRFGR